MRRQESHVLLLESYYGGSHRDFADGLVHHSRHSIDLLTLPARFWKWRMRGASLWFSRQLGVRTMPAEAYDLIFCTSLLDIAALRSLIGRRCPPVLLYCHETQLVYPQPESNDADLHFLFTDLVNMLAAERVVFNSRSHRDRFLSSLPVFLRRLPEFRPMWTVEEIAKKSTCCYPGIWATAVSDPPDSSGSRPPPLVIWNHRWEFDKAPSEFFAALRDLAERGISFRLALLGENFNTKPREFAEARRELGRSIVQYGYVADRQEYQQWLARGTVVVSTAIQENFGISVVEAIAHGCHPVLPHRLSYPELIPEPFHEECLYRDYSGLVDLLARRLSTSPSAGQPEAARADPQLSAYARSFEWPRRIEAFDKLIDETARQSV